MTELVAVDSEGAILGKDQIDARPETAQEALMGLLRQLGQGPRVFKNVDIVRKGNQIILPEGMSLREAGEWIQRKEEQDEQPVDFRREFDCYPVDGARALRLALEQIYGFVSLKSQNTMFGQIHPKLLDVPSGPGGQTEQIPWGQMAPLGIEGQLNTSMSTKMGLKFVLSGVVKKKHEQAMIEIADLTETILNNNSLYRGKAIRIDFNWEDIRQVAKETGTEPSPAEIAPKFMDPHRMTMDDIILSDKTIFELATSVLLRLEKPEVCKAMGIPQKHGVLLTGPYGTGKTLTARIIQQIATNNGWTFIYLTNPKDFATTVKWAKQYAPAIVFVEDIDNVVKGSSTSHPALREILNVIDGIDTKTTPIMSILTTNHPERIMQGFMRAGRIDSMVKFETPDSETAWKFVETYTRDKEGRSLLSEDLRADELGCQSVVGKSMEGFVPAFIRETVNKAMLAAYYRTGSNQAQVTEEDLVQAAASMRDHAKMADEFGTMVVEE